jgi:hypothetical protein
VPTKRIFRGVDQVAEEEALSGTLVLLSGPALLSGYFAREMSFYCLKYGRSEDITGSSLRDTVRQALADVNLIGMGEQYAHFMCNRKIRHGSFSETHVLLSNTLAHYSDTVPVRWAVAANAIRGEVTLLIRTFGMLQGNLCYILAGLRSTQSIYKAENA